MAETGVSTGVGPAPRGLKGHVAHGPDKDWEKVGKTVPVQLTAPVETVQWLRSNGYVLSRVFQEAASRLMGGGEFDRLETQIEFHKEQVTILEAARSSLAQRREEKESGEATERARLEAIQQLADLYYEQGRDDSSKFHRVSNIKWLEGRVRGSKILHGARPEDVLELILASRARP